MTLSLQQRTALGRSRRKLLRRTDHAGWNPRHRTADPLKLLHASMRGRVPSLVDLKYQRMALSPFGFFRGAVPVMASDLALTPNTGILNQLCGDAHVSNLGAFAGLDGRVVFDINDFDETIPGPFEWDVKRMATSILLAGREAGAKNSHCDEAAATFLESYRLTIHKLARMSVLDIARYQVHRLQQASPIANIFTLAQRATPLHNLLALTEAIPAPNSEKASSAKPHPALAPQQRLFKSNPPVLTRVTGPTARLVLDALTPYIQSLLPERRHFFTQYRPIDVAFKVVGTGSVGLRDYCVYLQGNGPHDPLFLQIKEETHSAYAPYLASSNRKLHQGRRVVEGERAMQLQSDPFLGWTTIQGRDYLVRQLNDHKASVNLANLKSSALFEYAIVCGEMLARGHARSGDPAVLAGYLGNSPRFDQAVATFASQYADQTEKDWHLLLRSSRVKKTLAKAAPKSA